MVGQTTFVVKPSWLQLLDFSPRCVFSNVSSLLASEDDSGMVRQMKSIGQPSCVMWICLTFLHCVFLHQKTMVGWSGR